jgi:hypothetical protein
MYTMKQSIEKAAKVLALTAALASGPAAPAAAETHPPVSKKEAQATKMAHKITQHLYDPANYPKGVPVRGILNGSVRIHNPIGMTHEIDNPVILVEQHPHAQTDKHKKLLDGTWIGVPAHDADGRVVLTPAQIHFGSRGGETETIHLNAKHDTILEGAGVYTTAVTGEPDALMAFDIQGEGNFPSVEVTTQGGK